MEKILTISIIFIMVAMLAITTVKAVSGATIVEDIYKSRGERYVADNPVTDEQAATIYAKAQEAVKVLEEAGATDVKKLDKQLNKEQKIKFEGICQEAAGVLGLTLTYKDGCVEVYKDGKKIDTYTFTDKLPYTGNIVNIVVVASCVVVIALAVYSIVRKKKPANA